MAEQILNLFIYVEEDLVSEVGVSLHEAEGSDHEKVALLRARVDSDCKTATRYRLVKPITRQRFGVMMRLSQQGALFEDIFRKYGENSLFVLTPILNGVPTFHEPEALSGIMPDYLKTYLRDGAFDLPQLMHDDYFGAITLLYNAGKYISAAKLLMSFVDTVAFIDSGDVANAFTSWLETYVNLPPVGVTSSELWEYRHGLLHMSNLASRAVLRGEVARLSLYVGRPRAASMVDTKDEKYFNLMDLIEALVAGLTKWCTTVVTNHDKFLRFVSRYDLTVSDARLARLERD